MDHILDYSLWTLLPITTVVFLGSPRRSNVSIISDILDESRICHDHIGIGNAGINLLDSKALEHNKTQMYRVFRILSKLYNRNLQNTLPKMSLQFTNNCIQQKHEEGSADSWTLRIMVVGVLVQGRERKSTRSWMRAYSLSKIYVRKNRVTCYLLLWINQAQLVPITETNLFIRS